jgi:hypothetical protein
VPARCSSLKQPAAHPVMSSCATAVRAIITAVGFCICISLSSTLPSFVSLISATSDEGVIQCLCKLPPCGAFRSGCHKAAEWVNPLSEISFR